MNPVCKKCGPVAIWEIEIHEQAGHRVSAGFGFWRTLFWGLLFALPFIVMCFLVAVIYK